MPKEAEAVRAIFTRYLELGSMGALIAELDRQGIQTKVNWRTSRRSCITRRAKCWWRNARN
jgi:Recombinase